MVNVSESSNWLVCGAALVNEASVDFLYCRWTCVVRGFEIVALTFIVVSERPFDTDCRREIAASLDSLISTE